MKILILLTAFISVSKPAFSWTEHGNGGNGIACFTDATETKYKSIELFDYAYGEAKILNGNPIYLGTDPSIFERAKVGLSRMARFDANEAKKYIDSLDAIIADPNGIGYLDRLNVVADSVSARDVLIFTPAPNCYIFQLAVQNEFPNPYLINIHKWFWLGMTLDDQAGLLIHEVIYREQLQRIDANYSDAIQHVVNYLSAPYFIGEVLTQDLYDELMTVAKLRHFIHHPNFPQSYSPQYAYDEKITLNWNDATNYCNSKLSPFGFKSNNLLQNTEDFGAANSEARKKWTDSPIGRRLFSEETQGSSLNLWIATAQDTPGTHSLYNFSDGTIQSGIPATEKHRFICKMAD